VGERGRGREDGGDGAEGEGDDNGDAIKVLETFRIPEYALEDAGDETDSSKEEGAQCCVNAVGEWRANGAAESNAADIGLPGPEAWTQYPLLVTQSSQPRELGGADAKANGERLKIVRANEEPVRIDSDLFHGAVFMYVKDVQPAIELPQLSREIQKRKSSVVLKGSFKRRVRFSDLLIGHEFLDGVWEPPRWQRRLILGFMKRVFPHLQISFDVGASVLAPVILDCKMLSVAECCPTQATAEHEKFFVGENTKHLGGYFASKQRSASDRLRYFKSRANLESHYFEPGFEYTFEFYQHNLSFTDYTLHFGGFFSLNVGRILRGRPAQFLIKDAATQDYLCYFQFWSARAIQFWAQTKTDDISEDTEDSTAST